MNGSRTIRAGMRADTGQAILEVAIIAPLLIFMTLASVEFGRYMYQGIELGNAARAGVEYGAQNTTTAADTYPAGGMVGAALADAHDIAISATASNSCSCYSAPGTTFACTVSTATMPCTASATDYRLVYVRVDASGTFTTFLAYPGIPSSIALTRTAIQQVSP